MASNVVGWFEIYVNDMARAKTFYESVFARKLEKIESDELEMWTFPWIEGAEGCGGALVKMNDVPVGPGGTLIYFLCEDCAVEEKRVAANGGEVLRNKFPIGQHGFISIAKDTEGNVIGLHSMK